MCEKIASYMSRTHLQTIENILDFRSCKIVSFIICTVMIMQLDSITLTKSHDSPDCPSQRKGGILFDLLVVEPRLIDDPSDGISLPCDTNQHCHMVKETWKAVELSCTTLIKCEGAKKVLLKISHIIAMYMYHFNSCLHSVL